jgi:ribosomal protein L15
LASGVIDIDALVKAGIVDKREAFKYGVKILGNGEVKNKYTVKLPTSMPAAKKIEKAGGTVSK